MARRKIGEHKQDAFGEWEHRAPNHIPRPVREGSAEHKILSDVERLLRLIEDHAVKHESHALWKIRALNALSEHTVLEEPEMPSGYISAYRTDNLRDFAEDVLKVIRELKDEMVCIRQEIRELKAREGEASL